MRPPRLKDWRVLLALAADLVLWVGLLAGGWGLFNLFFGGR
jgi:hypothetical protein